MGQQESKTNTKIGKIEQKNVSIETYKINICVRGSEKSGKTTLCKLLSGTQSQKETQKNTKTKPIVKHKLRWMSPNKKTIIKCQVSDVNDTQALQKEREKIKEIKGKSGLKLNHEDKTPVADLSEWNNEIYSNCDGCVFIFNLSKRDSWIYVDRYLSKVPKDLEILIVGNAVDIKERIVSENEVLKLIEGMREKGFQIHYLEASLMHKYGLDSICYWFYLPLIKKKQHKFEKQQQEIQSEYQISINEFDMINKEETYEKHLQVRNLLKKSKKSKKKSDKNKRKNNNTSNINSTSNVNNTNNNSTITTTNTPTTTMATNNTTNNEINSTKEKWKNHPIIRDEGEIEGEIKEKEKGKEKGKGKGKGKEKGKGKGKEKEKEKEKEIPIALKSKNEEFFSSSDDQKEDEENENEGKHEYKNDKNESEEQDSEEIEEEYNNTKTKKKQKRKREKKIKKQTEFVVQDYEDLSNSTQEEDDENEPEDKKQENKQSNSGSNSDNNYTDEDSEGEEKEKKKNKESYENKTKNSLQTAFEITPVEDIDPKDENTNFFEDEQKEYNDFFGIESKPTKKKQTKTEHQTNNDFNSKSSDQNNEKLETKTPSPRHHQKNHHSNSSLRKTNSHEGSDKKRHRRRHHHRSSSSRSSSHKSHSSRTPTRESKNSEHSGEGSKHKRHHRRHHHRSSSSRKKSKSHSGLKKEEK
ncbi:ras gtpase-related [Anaeramoeba flamelloides]|uniref:Ras gtpase-related n=1 Tax=Anaeramoeba flamelloides TaxID=1746091 RepID=A0AAV7ZNS0_9EUKA|nr:ras gtpase-related [Anaeramoeba flamelloides]